MAIVNQRDDARAALWDALHSWEVEFGNQEPPSWVMRAREVLRGTEYDQEDTDG